MPEKDDQYSDEEATRRMNEALRRAFTTPHKPQSEMKLGRKTKTPREVQTKKETPVK